MDTPIGADAARPNPALEPLVARGTMSRDGGPWEDDLPLTYERLGS